MFCSVQNSHYLSTATFCHLVCTYEARIWSFCPSIAKGLILGGVCLCVMTAVSSCWKQDRPPPSLDVQCVLHWKKPLYQDVDCCVELCCLQLDSNLLISSIFLLNKNFMYTGNEWGVAGKWCALAELLPCRSSEGHLYKNHIDLCQGSSSSHLHGLPLLINLRAVWARAASVNASKHFWEAGWIGPHAALSHPSCTALLLAGVILLLAGVT